MLSSARRRLKNPFLSSSAVINPGAVNGQGSVGWLLLVCGVIGPPVDIAVFTVEGALRPEYSPIRDFNSLLSLGPHGWVNVANFIVFGLLMTAFAVGVRIALRNDPAANPGAILLAVFGASLLVVGVFVADPGPNPVTVHGAIHIAASILGLAALTAACFVLAGHYERLAKGRRFAIYSRVTGVVFAVLFVATVALMGAGIAGLLQRIEILVISTWIVLLAVRLIREQAAVGSTPSMQADET